MEGPKLEPEKEYRISGKTFRGYYLLNNPLVISMAAIFAAFTCGMTLLFPLLLPQGFINIGDLAVMITALLFGPIVGLIAGGVGPMMADVILGYPNFAFFTLAIKGLEGFTIGLIANPRKRKKNNDLNSKDIIAVVIGGLIMVFGYFFVELFIFRDPGLAFSELPLNFIVQFGIGVIGSLIFVKTSRRNIIDNFPQVFEKIFIIEDEENKS